MPNPQDKKDSYKVVDRQFPGGVRTVPRLQLVGQNSLAQERRARSLSLERQCSNGEGALGDDPPGKSSSSSSRCAAGTQSLGFDSEASRPRLKTPRSSTGSADDPNAGAPSGSQKPGSVDDKHAEGAGSARKRSGRSTISRLLTKAPSAVKDMLRLRSI
eukprot:TRINITY_DN19515_c0_g1_i2.p1 TRINITY_DN19515_c0_g1~~TRINITY_DN19515_c0_g1_i2.p1  ORF type:complete len:174 (-),score=32.75 TRINITY_DN19515_c0_g1_i2:59-535(-)